MNKTLEQIKKAVFYQNLQIEDFFVSKAQFYIRLEVGDNFFDLQIHDNGTWSLVEAE